MWDLSIIVYKIRKKNLSTVSQNVKLNKSFDLLPNDALANTKKWQKPVHNIQVIGAEWNAKMKNNEEKGYIEEKALNIRAEEQKFCDNE